MERNVRWFLERRKGADGIMRTSNKEFQKADTVITTKQAVSEEITAIKELKPSKYVEVTTDFKDSTGAVIHTDTTIIRDEKYDLLMSESPPFAPGKPALEYREVDLWHIIDMIRAAG